MRFVRGVARARRSTFIVPPLKIVALARVLRSFAHAATTAQPSGYLMTVMPLVRAKTVWPASFPARNTIWFRHPSPNQQCPERQTVQAWLRVRLRFRIKQRTVTLIAVGLPSSANKA
jgi:hypothetical protein